MARPNNPADDPMVTLEGVELPRSTWKSIGACARKHGIQGSISSVDLHMSLLELAAELFDCNVWEVALPYSDDDAGDWAESAAGQRMELPKEFGLTSTPLAAKIFKRTKRYYEIWWHSEHSQQHGPNLFHTFETLRSKYWVKIGRYFRDYWFLNSHLTREEAFLAALDLAKKRLTDRTQMQPLMERIWSLANKAKERHRIVMLKEDLIPSSDANYMHFPTNCEADNMQIIEDFLSERNILIDHRKTDNPIPQFIDWLDEDGYVEESSFGFLRTVVPSPAMQLAERTKMEAYAAWVAEVARKKQEEKEKEEEHKRKEKEEAEAKAEAKRKKQKEAATKRKARKKEREEADDQAFLDKLFAEAPKLVPTSAPPRYEIPSSEWTIHMRGTFIYMRNLVEWLCLEKQVDAPSFFNDISQDEFVTTGMREVGLVACMFREEDLADERKLKAHMETWLPLPLQTGFREYISTFYEILVELEFVDDPTGNQMMDLVQEYTKKLKPVKVQ